MGYSLAANPDPDVNGERFLAEMLKDQINRFVDVGANVGDWSYRLIESVSPCAVGLLFEPSPPAVKHLRCRFGTHPNLKILEFALSDRAGRTRFFQESSFGETSSLVPGTSNANAVAIEVETVTLDEALEREGWPGADFVKIDAEGHDLNVMLGAESLLKRRALRFVQFEYGGAWARNGSTLGKAIGYLAEFGYETRVVTPEGPMSYRYGRFREFFRYCNFVAAPLAEWSVLYRDKGL